MITYTILGVLYYKYRLMGLWLRVMWDFAKIRVPYFGIPVMGFLLFRVLATVDDMNP